MNLLQLAWRNLSFKPLNALLSILLFALSIGLISLLLSLRTQADEQFDKNLAGVDLVVGAKGSPLELVLNSMYHVGYPNGNVTLGEVKSFFNPRHPVVADALPLSVGDNYRGYRIVGTLPDILNWYGVSVAAGDIWEDDFSVTIGAEVAEALQLHIGDQFRSTHGILDEGAEGIAHEDVFTVVGVLAESGTVMDQLILTTNPAYWHSHDHDHGPTEDTHDHAHDHDHGEPDNQPADPLARLLAADPEEEITSLLVRYRNASSFPALSFPRNLNENTELLAANPAYEINEVRRRFDSGQRILGLLVLLITIVSGLSIFIALYTSLRERRYELALLRAMGSGRGYLFGLIIAEGLIVAIIGYLLGMLLSHGVVAILAANVSGEFRYQLDPLRLLAAEGWLLVFALLLAFLAAVFPAISAARTSIGETLLGEG